MTLNLWTRKNFRNDDKIVTILKDKADYLNIETPEFGTLLKILENRKGCVKKVWPDESDGAAWKELKAEGYILIQWDEPIQNGKQLMSETWVMPHFCDLLKKGSEVMK